MALGQFHPPPRTKLYSSLSRCYAIATLRKAKGITLLNSWPHSLGYFRPYLFGNSFTLITDHEPLKWLMTAPKLSGKMAKWSLLLQEYAFRVQHRARTDNANVDCLSRYPLLSNAEAPVLDWSKEEVLLVTVYLAFMAGTLAPASPF